MRPVTVKLPTTSRILTKKVVSTTAIAFDLSSYVRNGGRTLVFVAGAADVYVIAGATAASITAPVIASVDGSVSASRAVPLPVGVHIPFYVDDTNCFLQGIAASASHLTVYEA